MSTVPVLTEGALDRLAGALGFAAWCIHEAPEDTRLHLEAVIMSPESAHIARTLIRFFTDLGNAHPELRPDDATAFVAQQHKEGRA